MITHPSPKADTTYHNSRYHSHLFHHVPSPLLPSLISTSGSFDVTKMYIIIQSEVGQLESTNQFLWQLCDPTQLSGEGGYYLTVFSSIVSLLHRIHLPALPAAESMDDVIQGEGNVDGDNEAEHGGGGGGGNVGVTPPEEEDVGSAGKWRKRVSRFWK